MNTYTTTSTAKTPTAADIIATARKFADLAKQREKFEAWFALAKKTGHAYVSSDVFKELGPRFHGVELREMTYLESGSMVAMDSSIFDRFSPEAPVKLGGETRAVRGAFDRAGDF